MHIRDPHVGFLSDVELYTVVKEQMAATEADVAALKEQLSRDDTRDQHAGIVQRLQPDNVRTIQMEVIKYFQMDQRLTSRQTRPSVAELNAELKKAAPELTELERLQIVNLLPQSAVELEMCVEEFEGRFGDEGEQAMLDLVSRHREVASGLTEEHHVPLSSLAPKSSKDEPMEEELEEEEAESEEEDMLVHTGLGGESGLSGGRDAEMRDIDEVSD